MWDFLKSLLKMILVIFIIFIIPFILPIILKIFLQMKVFVNIDEFKNIIDIFNSFYILIYILLGIIILLWFFHKWTDIKNIFKNMNFTFALGDKKISAEHIKEEIENINKQKEFMNIITRENNNDSEIIINEAREKLGIKQSKNKCKKCNKEEIDEENIKLRDFATYNIINTEARSLLHIMYNEKFVKSSEFRSKIIQGYKRRNRKNIKFSKNEIDKIAKNKYENIFEGLKFLNIIEPSEDDEIVSLTKNGKRFVETYIEKKEVV